MRVSSEYAEFDDPSYDALLAGRQQGSWLWFGLIVSLMLHLALCAYFYSARFQAVDPTLLAAQQTPTFKVKNVDLNALDKSSMDTANQAAKPLPDATDVQVPDEKKSFDKLLEEIHSSAAMPDDMQNALPDKPKVEMDATSVMTEIERSSAQNLSNNPNATHEQSLLNDSAVSGRPQPALSGTELATSTIIKRPNSFTSKIQADSAGPSKKGAPGFSDLNQLLAQKGPLGSGTKPILLPENQTFEYNSAELQASGIAQLQNLGTLIKRNPNATFTVEGYTDSFGPPEYNLELSQRRADTVKEYLVQAMGINPAQVATRGYGQSKFLVQPSPIAPGSPMEEEAEIRRQQPNRRVVIVVHTDQP